jgi:hypothetical protein
LGCTAPARVLPHCSPQRRPLGMPPLETCRYRPWAGLHPVSPRCPALPALRLAAY